MKQLLSTLVLFFSFHSSYSQNLVEAVKIYQLSPHFEYSSKIIRESKIESIEKLEYHLNNMNDSIDSGKFVCRVHFSRDGMPRIKSYSSVNCGNIAVVPIAEEAWTILSTKFKADSCSLKNLSPALTSVDSIRSSEDGIIIYGGPSPFNQGVMPKGRFSGNFLKLNLRDSLVEVQYESQMHYIFQDREEDRYSRRVSVLDFNLRLLKTELFLSPAKDSKLWSWEEYQYFDNGLLESVTEYDRNGKIISRTLYRLNYYN